MPALPKYARLYLTAMGLRPATPRSMLPRAGRLMVVLSAGG